MGPKRVVSNNYVEVESKAKRKSISLDAKLKILRRLESGLGATAVGREFGLNESSVRTIMKKKDKFIAAAQAVTPVAATKLTRTRNIFIVKMERLLAAWVKDMNQRGKPLYQAVIMLKAKSIFSELKEKEGEEYTPKAFTASQGWFYRFKNRYNLSSATRKKRQSGSRLMKSSSHFPLRRSHSQGLHGKIIKITIVDDNKSLPQQQCPVLGITDVGHPVTVSDTDQVVTAVGSSDERQNSIHLSDKTEVCVSRPSVSDASQEVQAFSEFNKPKQSVKQTNMLMNRITPLKRPFQPMRERRRWRKPTGSSVENQGLGLVTDRDSMAPNSKVAKSDANVIPHTVSQEAILFPQSTIAATQKEKRTLTVPNHQVAVMSNVVSMWKAGRLCDSYISNGSTKIMVHKMVLGAVCPKVLPILHSTSHSSFPTVIFPSSISKEGLLAFAEYMYSGMLDLNQDILVQLKTIAQIFDMKDFEQLCSNELNKAKAAFIFSAVVEPLLAEPCSLSGLLSSNTEGTTDPGHFQNTTLSPLLKLLENINSSNSSNSPGVVPTDNLATVGGLSSSQTFRSAQANTPTGQVIHVGTKLESNNKIIPTQNFQQQKMEPCSPVRDQYSIQEDLIDFENITSNTGVGLQLVPPGVVTIPSNMATNTDLSPTTSNFSPYPVGLFTADDIKIIPALQENYA